MCTEVEDDVGIFCVVLYELVDRVGKTRKGAFGRGRGGCMSFFPDKYREEITG